ncbi:MAG: hypothetical protein P4L55_12390 [Syntrophobacteraceae bacterium]|nr:hypothetical protein [Syntrophobacteraceae bacterium]
MENLQGLTGQRSSQSAGPGGDGENEDIGKLLREHREQTSKGNTDETPITDQMLNDPENGEFWRRMQAARKRVRNRLHAKMENTRKG